ncbi:MAG: response regulator, partial [Alphaproteobacteria bacterium]|nr:response regulator [Alphaproteobacteria bacterium]
RHATKFTSAALREAMASFDYQRDSDTSMPVILVVEDDWLLRQAMQDALAEAGWTVHEAESAGTALHILDRGDPIDLLITDLRLGGDIDGWDVADAFRGKNRDLPVIYVSANTPDEARQLPDSIFLSKPCDLGKLIEICKDLCRMDR